MEMALYVKKVSDPCYGVCKNGQMYSLGVYWLCISHKLFALIVCKVANEKEHIACGLLISTYIDVTLQ